MRAKYKRLTFIPVVLIGISLYIIGYNVVRENEGITNPEITALAEASDDSFVTEETENSASSENKPIDINSADVFELMTLPGIKEKRAKAIIELRKEMNGFNSIDELIYVSGIGHKTLDKIKENAVVLPYKAETDK